jgi:RNA polymerase sigma-70 factor, ECF subfamily
MTSPPRKRRGSADVDAGARDALLLERLRAGDRSAFTELVRAYRADVFRLVRARVSTDADAEDVTQQALVRALRAIGTFRGDASLRTWLHRIAVNAALNHARDARSGRSISLDDVEIITNALSTGRMSAREARRKLAAAVRELPPKQRLVVELRIVHELSFAAVAGIAGCSEDSAKANFRHAVARLRELSGLADGR